MVLDTLIINRENPSLTKEILKAMTCLMTQQPDLLEEEGIKTIIDFLDQQKDAEIQKWILKWVKECCVLHEINRF